MSKYKLSSVRWVVEELERYELGKSEFFSKTAIVNHADRMHEEEVKTCMSVAFIDGVRSNDENYKTPHEDWEDYYKKAFGN